MIEVLNITEKEYRGAKCPSYSLLKQLDENGPKSLLYKDFIGGEAVEFGSIVDSLMNTDFSQEEFDKKFYFKPIEKPTGQLLELADYLIKNEPEELNNYIKNNVSVEAVSQALELFGSIKDYDKRVAKFDTDLFWNYLVSVYESKGKIIFTPDTLNDANEAVMILKTHDKTKNIYTLNENQEYFDQLKLKVYINDKPVKVMLDRVIVDNENKIVQPYDLKCTDVRQRSFRYIFKKMKYYLQSSLYRYALLWWVEENYPGYDVQDFKFIVYSRADKYPFIWNVPDNWYANGLYGFTDEVGQYHKGIYELLKDYYYYVENEDYTIEREFKINNVLDI